MGKQTMLGGIGGFNAHVGAGPALAAHAAAAHAGGVPAAAHAAPAPAAAASSAGKSINSLIDEIIRPPSRPDTKYADKFFTPDRKRVREVLQSILSRDTSNGGIYVDATYLKKVPPTATAKELQKAVCASSSSDEFLEVVELATHILRGENGRAPATLLSLFPPAASFQQQQETDQGIRQALDYMCYEARKQKYEAERAMIESQIKAMRSFYSTEIGTNGVTKAYKAYCTIGANTNAILGKLRALKDSATPPQNVFQPNVEDSFILRLLKQNCETNVPPEITTLKEDDEDDFKQRILGFLNVTFDTDKGKERFWCERPKPGAPAGTMYAAPSYYDKRFVEMINGLQTNPATRPRYADYKTSVLLKKASEWRKRGTQGGICDDNGRLLSGGAVFGRWRSAGRRSASKAGRRSAGRRSAERRSAGRRSAERRSAERRSGGRRRA